MQTLVLLLALLLGAMPDARSETAFTHEQQAEALKSRAAMERACRQAMDPKIGYRLMTGANAFSRWLVTLARSPTYCTCAADAYQSTITPENLHSSEYTSEDEETVRTLSQGCLAKQMRETFPNFCYEFVGQLRGSSLATALPLATGKFCHCVQPAIDQLTSSSVMTFVRATTRDFQQYEETQDYPDADASSLLTKMHACGLTQIRYAAPDRR